MIDIDTRLTGDVSAGLDKLEAKIKQQILFSGVAAMALVFYNEVRLNASRNRKSGTLYDAIYRVYSPESSSDVAKVYKVSVNKKKAPHWAFLEFGTSRMTAKPYIRPAISRRQDAIKAGLKRMAERMAQV
jgi:HK97 gp10 family phage protein